ncbi:MAG: hypothetical protein EZS28_007579 [Streblomastix strix]|uniref:Tyr recombinase domain-containing protein n=1 Tax=Streblomastix strix TaxID=222440 RepID=A0A5J4WR83_9EUKA|nr:MAG: hypothetical protein EZS28_007579 [Streblomastix strix]
MRRTSSHAAVKEARTAANMFFEVICQPFPQKLLSIIMKENNRETAKVNSKEEIWHLVSLLLHLSTISKKPNQPNQIILAACLSSIIAFTNLRLSELYEANIDILSNTNLKLIAMIWKGSYGRVQLNLRKMNNDGYCPVFWTNQWKMINKDNKEFQSYPWAISLGHNAAPTSDNYFETLEFKDNSYLNSKYQYILGKI